MHRTVPSHAFVHVSSSSHCAVHARLIARVRGARASEIRPAHVSANLIYFGSDKKLIYREARPASLGKRRFSAPSREPEVTRRLAQVSGADQVTMKSLLAMRCKKKEQEALKRKRRGGIDTSKFRLKRMFKSLEIEN